MGLHFMVPASSVGSALGHAIIDIAKPLAYGMSEEVAGALMALTNAVNDYLWYEPVPDAQLVIEARECGVIAHVQGVYRVVALDIQTPGVFIARRDSLILGDRVKWVSSEATAPIAM